MRLHVGATPAEVAPHLVDFMSSLMSGEPGFRFQEILAIRPDSKFEQLDDSTFCVTTTSGAPGNWVSVYRMTLIPGRPGTDIEFKLESFTDAPGVVTSALDALTPRWMVGSFDRLGSRGQRKQWSEAFTRYVRQRCGPEIRMTMQPQGLAGL